MKILLPLVAVVLTTFQADLTAADWPRFRGPDGRAASDDASVPVTFGQSKNVLWKAPLPGRGSSSPVIVNGRVYVTAYTGYGLDPDEPGEKKNLTLHVLAFRADTGKPLWDKSFAASDSEQEVTRRVADHGYATNTPVADSHGVVAYFGVSGLVALSHDGTLLWKAHTGDKTAGFGSAASPILYRDLVIINASIESGCVIAFDRQTGKEKWRVDGIERSWTTPIVAQSATGRDELIVSHKLRVRGLAPLTGTELWSCRGIQDYVVPCVVAEKGIAWVLGGRKNQSLAIRLGGDGEVSDTHILWENNVGANVTSPVCHNGHLYWLSDRGIYHCLDASTGLSKERTRVSTRQRVYASIVRTGSRLLLTTRDNGIFVIDATPEYKEIAHNVLDDGLLNATPAVSDGRLFLRTDRFLYCIGRTE